MAQSGCVLFHLMESCMLLEARMVQLNYGKLPRGDTVSGVQHSMPGLE